MVNAHSKNLPSVPESAILALDIFKKLSLPETDRCIEGLVYLNKVYEKYITLVGNSAILNPMNKHDKLLVIHQKLLISGGSSIYSNDFNNSPITDKEDL